MNKVIKLGMLFHAGKIPDFGSIQQKNANPNILYLTAEDIPKLNGMLTRSAAESYLPERSRFSFHTGALAFIVDYKTAGTGKIYAYHRGKDHWYEFNIRSDLGLFDLMWNRHERILRETKTINGTPPLTFESNSRTLKNYRIYGNTVNGESVGNLVTEGEHTGEYCVPATITNGTITKTANIYLPEQLRKVGNESEYIDYKKQKQYRVRKNLFNPSNITPNINLSSTTGLPTKYNGRIGISIPILTNGNVTLSYRTKNNININFMYTIFRNDTFIARTVNKSNGDTINCENGDKIYIAFYIEGTSISMNDISNIMLNSGTEVLSYESYIEDTELDVTLPPLPTISDTNILSVGTTVQPSNIEINGGIKAVQ